MVLLNVQLTTYISVMKRGGCSAWCHLTSTNLFIIILSVNVHILFLVYIAAGIAAHNRLLRRDNSRNSTQSSRRLAESRGVPWLSRHWKHFMAQELLMQSAHTHTHIHTQKYLYIYIYICLLLPFILYPSVVVLW